MEMDLSMIEIVVPSLGPSEQEATVSGWGRKSGEAVAEDELLVELETDTGDFEIVAPSDGILTCTVLKGATVRVGQVLGYIT